MPFRNFAYSVDRQFPVAESDAEFTFKASFNFSSSVDRIITVSKDSLFGYQGNILEIYSLPSKKKGEGRLKYVQRNITPNSGFKRFIDKVDSMNLASMKNQENFEVGLHHPFSLYVIEIKHNGKYSHFKFNTYFPDTAKVSPEYEQIQKLIVKEFDFPLYFK